MKLFVPFATSDNGVYISEEKRAEVVPGENEPAEVVLVRARALAARKSCASGWRLPRALTASQDTTLIIIRCLVTLVTPLPVRAVFLPRPSLALSRDSR